MASKSSSGSKSSSSSAGAKAVSNGKVTFNLPGGKSVTMTGAQLSALSPELKAGLNASLASGATSYSGQSGSGSGSSSGTTPKVGTGVGAGAGSGSGSSNGSVVTPPVKVQPKVDTTAVGGTTSTTAIGAKKFTDVNGNSYATQAEADKASNPGTKQISSTEAIKATPQITPDTTKSFGADAMSKETATPGYLESRNNTIANDLKASGKTDEYSIRTYLQAQPGFTNADKTQQENTVKTIMNKVTPPPTEIKGIEDQKKAAEDFMTKAQAIIDANNAEVDSRIGNYAGIVTSTGEAMDNVIKSRLSAMQLNFDTIKGQIGELTAQANSLFDNQKIAALKAREGSLAAQGILTGEQSAVSGQRLVEDYSSQVELKRGELMKSAKEMMINAEKERAALNDNILQQQGLDVATKASLQQGLTEMYTNMSNNYATLISGANNTYANMITGVNSQQAQVDIGAAGPTIENTVAINLSKINKERANSDPSYRYDYIINQLKSIDANLARYAVGQINTDIANKNFSSTPIDQYISSLVAKIMPQYRKDTK